MVTPTALPGPRTTIQRHPREGNLGGEWRQRWKHSPSIRFSGTIKESTDGAETLEEDTRRNIGTTDTSTSLTQEGSKEQGGIPNRHTASWPVTRAVDPWTPPSTALSWPLYSGALKRDATLLTPLPPAPVN
jgi:hypothetical protein